MHDKESCPVCSQTQTVTPEEYLNRIEETVNRIPAENIKERMDRVVFLTAGTAAIAAEHQDMAMLKIVEVYLALRLAEETGKIITPEEGSKLFRELSKRIGLGLTAKYGLEGLAKVGLEGNQQPGTASLVFMTCYGIGKVLAYYFQRQSEGVLLTDEEAKAQFKAAKVEAERISATL